MKILVFPHRLDVGGVQVNVADLSAALRDFHGHDVAVFATPGPMLKLLEDRKLRFIPAPDAHKHPSWSRMTALARVLRQERPDVLYVWDWPQFLDSYYLAHLVMRIPMVITNMSMTLDRLLPKRLPMTFGTPELVDQAKSTGRRKIDLLLPPVDVEQDAPGAVDPKPFMEKFGLRADDINLVTVSRLVSWMKAESIRGTIEIVRALGREYPVRFVIVGDGTSRQEIQSLADEVNAELNRDAIVLTGAMIDPRPAYAAATIVVGMGGSALRGMAFGKPVIVVGERGFAAPFTPETSDMFLYKGIYGLGTGADGQATLTNAVAKFLEIRNELPAIGAYSREFVVRHFGLKNVSNGLDRCLRSACDDRYGFSRAAVDGLRSLAVHLSGTFVIRPLRSALSAVSRAFRGGGGNG